MKKLLTLAAVLGTTAVSFGQGYVDFHNLSTTRVSNGAALQANSAVGSYYYALLVAPTTQNTISSSDGSFAGWTFAAYGTNANSAGRLSGNSADAGGSVQIAGFSATSTGDFAIVGWSANIGSDWNTVRAGFHGFGSAGSWTVTDASMPGGSSSAWFGVSVVANDIALAPFGGPYNSVFGPSSAGQIPGLQLQSVAIPEPTTLGLVGLGAAALVIFRRRKA
jgi:hypothetical protein